MPAQGKPTEYGGKVQRNGVQPPPHVPTASEQVMLAYTTGDPSGATDRDGGAAWEGLLPPDEARKQREASGVPFDEPGVAAEDYG